MSSEGEETYYTDEDTGETFCSVLLTDVVKLCPFCGQRFLVYFNDCYNCSYGYEIEGICLPCEYVDCQECLCQREMTN